MNSLRSINAMRAMRRFSNGRPQLRFNSTGTTGVEKQNSKHVDFYKTFTRPISKVLLLAVFTYQVAYWGWVRLEKDEVKRVRNGEIKVLEEELKDLMEKKEQEKAKP
ncbi:hypothetical protein BGZ60DRAFT_534024 [Tricladium varicosporioides]|nr:hypothetical protein BGZ60DRAFT_534024 [Hymenoscyphus varicosporioides]